MRAQSHSMPENVAREFSSGSGGDIKLRLSRSLSVCKAFPLPDPTFPLGPQGWSWVSNCTLFTQSRPAPDCQGQQSVPSQLKVDMSGHDVDHHGRSRVDIKLV